MNARPRAAQVRAFAFAQGGLAAAARLHDALLGAVVAAPAAFFDGVPAGRALNRFSSDAATVRSDPNPSSHGRAVQRDGCDALLSRCAADSGVLGPARRCRCLVRQPVKRGGARRQVDDALPFILNILLANAAALAGVAAVLALGQPALAAAFLPLGLLFRLLQARRRVPQPYPAPGLPCMHRRPRARRARAGALPGQRARGSAPGRGRALARLRRLCGRAGGRRQHPRLPRAGRLLGAQPGRGRAPAGRQPGGRRGRAGAPIG